MIIYYVTHIERSSVHETPMILSQKSATHQDVLAELAQLRGHRPLRVQNLREEVLRRSKIKDQISAILDHDCKSSKLKHQIPDIPPNLRQFE